MSSTEREEYMVQWTTGGESAGGFGGASAALDFAVRAMEEMRVAYGISGLDFTVLRRTHVHLTSEWENV